MGNDWSAEQSVEVLRDMLTREVRKREAVEAQAARLAAVEPIVEAAVALHECLRRCGPEWAERLRAVYDAVAVLNTGAAGEATDG